MNTEEAGHSGGTPRNTKGRRMRRWLLRILTAAAVVVLLITGLGIPQFMAVRRIQQLGGWAEVEIRSGGAVGAIPDNPLLSLFGEGWSVGFGRGSQRNFTDKDMWVLKPLRNLRDVWLGHTAITGQGLSYLNSQSHLRSLSLNRTAIRDVTLRTLHLENFPNLHLLNLSGTPVTGTGLAGKGTCPSLRVLLLNDTRLNDDGMATLRRFTNLQVLQLAHTDITSSGVAELPAMAHLRALGLQYTGVGDRGLAGLARLKGLTGLYLAHTRITSGGLKALQPLAGNLMELSLNGCKINNQGLRYLLANFPKLKLLRVSSPLISDAGLAGPIAAKGLTALDLSYARVNDKALVRISRLKHLESLHLNHTAVDDHGLSSLASLHDLVSLQLAWTNVKGPGLKSLSHLAALQSIYLAGDGIRRRPLPPGVIGGGTRVILWPIKRIHTYNKW